MKNQTFNIGRVHSMQDRDDEEAVLELHYGLKDLFSIGVDAPDDNTLGRVYFRMTDDGNGDPDPASAVKVYIKYEGTWHGA